MALDEQKQEHEPALLPASLASPASAPKLVSRSTVAMMREHGNPHPDLDWVNQTRHPLFWEPLQDKPIAAKLTAMRVALNNAADPNMIDREPEAPRNRGRPLHCAIAAGRTLSCNQGVAPPWAARRGNLPVIELLLERGADPRLGGQDAAAMRPGPRWLLSPIEEAEVNMAYPTGNPDEDFEEIKAFYTQVLVMMKAAAERLDRQDAGETESKSNQGCQVS